VAGAPAGLSQTLTLVAFLKISSIAATEKPAAEGIV